MVTVDDGDGVPDSDRFSDSKEVPALHREIDRQARELAERLGERITCRRGCADCCVDGITIFEVEADRIRRDVGEGLSGASPRSQGACAFLDDDLSCRIYSSRPYVCRTQGLPLRWIDEQDGEIVEFRDICPHNDAGEPIETLPESDCWTIGPAEQRLAVIQRASRKGGADRVALRDLFDELANTGSRH